MRLSLKGSHHRLNRQSPLTRKLCWLPVESGSTTGRRTHTLLSSAVDAALLRCFWTVTEGQDFSCGRDLSSKKARLLRCLVFCQGKLSELNSCNKYQIPNSQWRKFSINKTKNTFFFSLTELKKSQQCVMCQASLPPATASAQRHIWHPLLTLLILLPLESAPACKPRPPADEDLGRKDCLLTQPLRLQCSKTRS